MQTWKKWIRSLKVWILISLSISLIILFTILKELSMRVRNTSCIDCFRHDFHYIINNERICSVIGPEHSIDLMIVIFTEHENYKAREAVRNTWLTVTKNNTANIRYAFLLGKTGSDSEHELVMQENKLHRDILKEDFLDTYKNLTYKTIMGFKWVSTYCTRAKFVLKTDDDMFINVPKIVRFLNESGGKLREDIVGYCFKDQRPIRKIESKWYVSEDIYNEDKYPQFCSGTGYIASKEIVKKIYNVSRSVPFLPLEDVYIGLCLRKVGGSVKHVEGFKLEILRPDPCIYKGDELYTAHHVTPEMLQTIWTSPCITSNIAVKQLESWVLLSFVTAFYLSCICIFSTNY